MYISMYVHIYGISEPPIYFEIHIQRPCKKLNQCSIATERSMTVFNACYSAMQLLTHYPCQLLRVPGRQMLVQALTIRFSLELFQA